MLALQALQHKRRLLRSYVALQWQTGCSGRHEGIVLALQAPSTGTPVKNALLVHWPDSGAQADVHVRVKIFDCRYVVPSVHTIGEERWLQGLKSSYLGRLLSIPIWDKVEVYVWCEIAPQQGSKDLGAELCAKWAQSLLKELNKHRLLHISGTHG